MIVKRKEWEELLKYEENLKNEYEKIIDEKDVEINSLKKQISKLEKKIKPDKIIIKVYKSESYYSPKNYIHYDNWQISESTIDMTSNICNQIRKILNDISKKFKIYYDDQIKINGTKKNITKKIITDHLKTKINKRHYFLMFKKDTLKYIDNLYEKYKNINNEYI